MSIIQKPIEAAMALIIISAVLVVGGILTQSLQDGTVTCDTCDNKSFNIAGVGLNATEQAAIQTSNAGTIVGVLFLIVVAVALLTTIAGLVTKFKTR